MSECQNTCCGNKKEYSQSQLYRSIALILLGVMPMLSQFDSVLHSQQVSQLYFLVASCALAYTIFKDYKNVMPYCAAACAFASFIVFASFVTNTYMIYVLSASIVPAFIVLMFTKDDLWESLSALKLSNEMKSWHTYFEFPSVDKMLYLFVMMNWAMSLNGLLIPGAMSCALAIHDALLIVGIYNLTGWLQDKIRSSVMNQNHSFDIEVTRSYQDKTIKIRNLQQGDVIHIKEEMMIPVKSIAVETVVYKDGESTAKVQKEGAIPAHQSILSGKIRCSEDYVPITTSTKQNNDALKLFLSIAFSSSVASGLFVYFSTGVLLGALQAFCLNTIITCPCVFMALNLIFQSKITKIIQEKTDLSINKSFNIASPDIIVFDRTNTLYIPPATHTADNEAYVMPEYVAKLLKELDTRNVELYIVSGHATQGYKEHLRECREKLPKIAKNMKSENIIFDAKFHEGGEGNKKDVIKNLQLYGSIEAPKTFTAYLKARIMLMFSRKTVMMIGDGTNDADAMAQADLAVCISKERKSINDHAISNASFYLEQEKIGDVQVLVQLLMLISPNYYGFLYFASFSCMAMVLLANPIFPAIMGIHLLPKTACMVSFSLCFIYTAAAAMTDFSHLKIDNLLTPKDKGQLMPIPAADADKSGCVDSCCIQNNHIFIPQSFDPCGSCK